MVPPSMHCFEHVADCIAVSVLYDCYQIQHSFILVKEQECGVGVGVGIARSRGNQPGCGVGVGVNQATLTPTQGRLLQFDPG